MNELPVVGLADLVDGADVRMLERGRGARLDEEALLRVGVRAEVRRQELERDVRVRGARRAPDRRRPCRRRRGGSTTW